MPSAHQDPAEQTERNAAIVAARVGGETLDGIARRFGVSRPRVRQILRAASRADADAEREARRAEVAAAFAVQAEAVADGIGRAVPESAQDPHPPTTLRLALAAGRVAGFSFEEAWAIGAAAALSSLTAREANDWREVFASTRRDWEDAYEGRRAPLAGLPRPGEDQ